MTIKCCIVAKCSWHRSTFVCVSRRRRCVSCLDRLKSPPENPVQPRHTSFHSVCFWVASSNHISRTKWQDWWDGQIKERHSWSECWRLITWFLGLSRDHQPIRNRRRRAAEWLVVLTTGKWRDVRHMLTHTQHAWLWLLELCVLTRNSHACDRDCERFDKSKPA